MSAFCCGCRDGRVHTLALREGSGEEQGRESHTPVKPVLWGGRARGTEAGQGWGLEVLQAADARRSFESSPAGDHDLQQLEISTQRSITKVFRTLKEKRRRVGGEREASGEASWRRQEILQAVLQRALCKQRGQMNKRVAVEGLGPASCISQFDERLESRWEWNGRKPETRGGGML